MRFILCLVIGACFFCVDKMLDWLKEFMNTYQEFHAAVEGFCEGFLIIFPWLNRYKPNEELSKDISDEHHYYAPGIVFGVICFVLFGVGIYKLVI